MCGRDGESNNLSWNCGTEGPTDDLGIQRLRARQQRNLAAALLLAQGVPMVVMGDEHGHSKVLSKILSLMRAILARGHISYAYD